MSRLIASLTLMSLSAVALLAWQTAPSQLQLAAGSHPLVFAMMLAHASVPAGVELRASDAKPRGRPDFGFRTEPAITTAALADAFNVTHIDYRATLSDGVLVIRPTGPTAPFLDRPSGIGRVEVTGVMEAARQLFAGLDPRLAAPGGRISSGINLDPSQSGDDVRLVLDGTGRTVIDVLNQIARQSGKVWFVEDSDDPKQPNVVRFGFLHPGGSSTGIDVTAGRK
jgi:hypothetical protein